MNILGMGPTEILLIVVLALIVFGPAKLPEIMGNVGKAIADFRRATSQLSDEFNRTIQAELNETRALVDDTKSTVTGVQSAMAGVQTSLSSALTGLPAPVRTADPAPANGVAVPNGTNGTTPTSPTPATPPVADTMQWSWESAAPAPIAPAVQVTNLEPAPTLVSDVVSETAPATSPERDQPSRKAPRKSARDELQPPY